MAGRLDRLWANYEEHHRAAGNKWCHMVGIPLIIVGLLGLLAVPVFRVGEFPVEAALLLVVVAGAAYLWLDAKLGAAMLLSSAAIYFGARLLDWRVALGVFLLGWVFQFMGHGIYEKRSPAFFSNLTHLLVGPLWVLNHALRLRRG
ncbi:MAG: Mpo1-like protein [Terriglobia bacterium]